MKGLINAFVLGVSLLLLQGCITAPGLTIEFSGVEAGPEHGAKVKAVEGKAQVRATKDSKWEDLLPGVELPAGTVVRTETQSKVQLEFSDGSTLMVQPNSEVGLRSIESPVVGNASALNVTVQVFQGRLEGEIHGGAGGTTFSVVTADGTPISYTPAPGQTMSMTVAVRDDEPLFVFPNASWGMHPNFDVNDWRALLAVRPIPEPASLGMVALAAPLIFLLARRRGQSGTEAEAVARAKSSCQAPRFLR